VDSYGRTPVHYAAVRGHSDAIFHLLDLFNKAEKKQAAAAAPAGDNDGDSTYRRVLTMKDRGMRTPLQLAELTPLQNYSSDVLRYAMGLYEVSAPRNAAAAAVVEDAYSYSLQESDAADRRGGWHFPLSDSDGAERAAAAAVAGAFGPFWAACVLLTLAFNSLAHALAHAAPSLPLAQAGGYLVQAVLLLFGGLLVPAPAVPAATTSSKSANQWRTDEPLKTAERRKTGTPSGAASRVSPSASVGLSHCALSVPCRRHGRPRAARMRRRVCRA
jgi:hypothetical protein